MNAFFGGPASRIAPAVAAAIYVAAGLRIFPCDPASKRPLIGDWPNVATSDAAQVAAWWAQWPAALVGLALKGSRLLILDGDNHHEEAAGAESGVDFLWRNLAHFGVAPVGWATTAGAGVHVPTWLPEGVTHGNASPWAAGYIDVRGPGNGTDGGGYAILPGSVRADGARWWVDGPAFAGLGEEGAIRLYAHMLASGEGLPPLVGGLGEKILGRREREVAHERTARALVGVGSDGFPPGREGGIGRFHAEKLRREFLSVARPGAFNAPVNDFSFRMGAVVRLGRMSEEAAERWVLDALTTAGGFCEQHAETARRALAAGIGDGTAERPGADDRFGGGAPVSTIWGVPAAPVVPVAAVVPAAAVVANPFAGAAPVVPAVGANPFAGVVPAVVANPFAGVVPAVANPFKAAAPAVVNPFAGAVPAAPVANPFAVAGVAAAAPVAGIYDAVPPLAPPVVPPPQPVDWSPPVGSDDEDDGDETSGEAVAAAIAAAVAAGGDVAHGPLGPTGAENRYLNSMAWAVATAARRAQPIVPWLERWTDQSLAALRSILIESGVVQRRGGGGVLLSVTAGDISTIWAESVDGRRALIAKTFELVRIARCERAWGGTAVGRWRQIRDAAGVLRLMINRGTVKPKARPAGAIEDEFGVWVPAETLSDVAPPNKRSRTFVYPDAVASVDADGRESPPSYGREAEIAASGVGELILFTGWAREGDVQIERALSQTGIAAGGAVEWRGIARAPFARPDGSVAHLRGRDPVTGWWLAPEDGQPDANNPRLARLIAGEAITREEAFAALGRILRIFETTDFANELSRVAAAAYLIAGACRPSLPHLPIALISSLSAGAGKGTIAEMIAVAIVGDEGRRQQIAWNDKSTSGEMEKRVGAAVLDGCDAIMLDNLPEHVPNLADIVTAVTEDSTNIRVLGESRSIQVDCRGLFLSAAGNNTVYDSDFARRGVPIRLRATRDEFGRRRRGVVERSVLVDRVRVARPQSTLDALTVVVWGAQQRRAGAATQQRLTPPAVESYAALATLVRDPIHALIGLDFLADTRNRESVRAEVRSAADGELLSALYDVQEEIAELRKQPAAGWLISEIMSFHEAQRGGGANMARLVALLDAARGSGASELGRWDLLSRRLAQLQDDAPRDKAGRIFKLTAAGRRGGKIQWAIKRMVEGRSDVG